MTAITDRAGQAHGASPVDFEAYGDYGDFSRGKASASARSAEFVRAAYPFRGRITADGSSGYPAEAGRYHLYISWACPWAQRTAIVRKLLGLAGRRLAERGRPGQGRSRLGVPCRARARP